MKGIPLETHLPSNHTQRETPFSRTCTCWSEKRHPASITCILHEYISLTPSIDFQTKFAVLHTTVHYYRT